MSGKAVLPRRAAEDDIGQAIDHDRSVAGPAVALAFVDAVRQAFGRIARHPGLGSPRLAVELRIDGLRGWPLRRFPHLVVYVEHDDHIDVWRVLHAQRDIPVWMREADGR